MPIVLLVVLALFALLQFWLQHRWRKVAKDWETTANCWQKTANQWQAIAEQWKIRYFDEKY